MSLRVGDRVRVVRRFDTLTGANSDDEFAELDHDNVIKRFQKGTVGGRDDDEGDWCIYFDGDTYEETWISDYNMHYFEKIEAVSEDRQAAAKCFLDSAKRVELVSFIQMALQKLSGKCLASEKRSLQALIESVPVADSLDVSVSKLDGTNLKFQASVDDKVQEVKLRIAKELGIKETLQVLVHESMDEPLTSHVPLAALLGAGTGISLSLVVKPSDEHFQSVVVLLTPEAPSNVNKANGKELHSIGVTLDCKTSHAYGSSFALGSKKDVGLLVPWCSDFDFGAGDLTIEAWLRIEPGIATENEDGGGPDPMFFTSGWFSETPIDLYCRSMWSQPPREEYLRYNADTPLDDGLFHHYAFVRHRDHLMMFLDGKLKTNRAPYAGVFDSKRNLFIGSTNNSELHGPAHISEFRITKGVARYEDDFEPPSAFPTA